MTDLRYRLYQTKLTLLAVVFVVVGVGLLLIARHSHGRLLSDLPVADIGSGLFTTGLIGVALQYLDARDADERASDRLRRVLAEEAPAIRDAVIDGFAFSPQALAGVISPEVLERVATNCLALQLGDQALAVSAHEHLRRQAMTPAVRLSDSRLSVSLSAGSEEGLLRVTVRREYRFLPSAGTMRFSCVGTRDEYEALLRDPETTEVWRVRASDGISAADATSFTLTSVDLDGQPQTFRRLERKSAQVFTCRLPVSLGASDQHHLAYEYDVTVPRAKHCLYFDFGRPTFGLSVDVEGDATVEGLQLLDFLGDTAGVRHSYRRDPSGGTEASVAEDGWVLPRAGVVVVWR
jgi:hypothetical protein